ncbi:hypothetical protein Ccrd_001595 [Cynara cardunculus var. scolymus]|uniref:Uncharacterized protein n=1 Tax=Cynara cardunculus var. scolymus TaxID=59895 RepID=A0A103XSZ1_CYNCS|nr:hypothetical protein Ccrd_001595 [Cynara cardunculus var. scolymus]
MFASTTMNILKIHAYRLQPPISHLSHPTSPATYHNFMLSHVSSTSILSSRPRYPISKTNARVSEIGAPLWMQKDDQEEDTGSSEDLTMNGEAYQKTLRLVECAMFAALGGLAYILSSSLAIENYFGCFFALPIVFSSMRWDIVAGRKTMVATATLLLVLAGPIKAITYLVSESNAWFSWSHHGLFVEVRAAGAMGYVVMYSFLIRENILALLLLNCCFFVFLLHLLYALFFTRLGMKASLRLPKWFAKAI